VRSCLPAVLVLVSLGCGEVVKSTPDGDVPIDGPPSDGDAMTMPDGETSPLPREATGFSFVGANFLPMGTVASGVNGLTRVTVGTAAEAIPDKRDGYIIVRELGNEPQGWRIDGGRNDQLLAVASTDDRYAGVGLTRSYLGTLTQDHGLGVFLANEAFTVRNYFVTTDEGIQIRAVTPSDSEWVIGGSYQNGARGFVAIVDRFGQPLGAISFSPDTGTSEVVVRRLIRVVDSIFVIGLANRGAVRVGFLLSLDVTTLDLKQAVAFEAPNGVELTDAAVVGTVLHVVGSTAQDGISFEISQTGTPGAFKEWPGHRISAIRSTTSGLYVAGSVGSGEFSGVLDDDSLRAVELTALANNAFSPDILVAGPLGAIYYGERAGAVVEVPLNDTPVGACNEAAYGSPTSATAGSSTVTAYLPTSELRALGLQSREQIMAVSRTEVAEIDACSF